jgi:hypothetical protein
MHLQAKLKNLTVNSHCALRKAASCMQSMYVESEDDT